MDNNNDQVIEILHNKFEIDTSKLKNLDQSIILENYFLINIQHQILGIQKFINYEVWDLEQKKQDSFGRIDNFGTIYLSKFEIYQNTQLMVLISRSGEREIVIQDFVNNQRISFIKNMKSDEFQKLNKIQQKFKLISLSSINCICLIEKQFFYSNNENGNKLIDLSGTNNKINKSMRLSLQIIKKNNLVAQIDLQMNYTTENEKIKIFQHQNQNIIIVDQNKGEVLIWDFLRFPKKPHNIQLDCQNYNFKFCYLEKINNEQLIKFIVKDKNDNMIKNFIYNFKKKYCYVKIIRPHIDQWELLDSCCYTQYIQFKELKLLLIINQYTKSEKVLFFNLYEKIQESDFKTQDDCEFQLIDTFQQKFDNNFVIIKSKAINSFILQNLKSDQQLEINKKLGKHLIMKPFQNSDNNNNNDYNEQLYCAEFLQFSIIEKQQNLQNSGINFNYIDQQIENSGELQNKQTFQQIQEQIQQNKTNQREIIQYQKEYLENVESYFQNKEQFKE